MLFRRSQEWNACLFLYILFYFDLIWAVRYVLVQHIRLERQMRRPDHQATKLNLSIAGG